MSIHLSKKHGINPSVMLCFFCQESVGVALLGRLKGDEKAPREAVFDNEPCNTCKKHMEAGVILISVRKGEKESNPYRTGGWVVIKDEAIARMVEPKELRDDILRRRVAFIPDDAWEMLGLPSLPSTKTEHKV